MMKWFCPLAVSIGAVICTTACSSPPIANDNTSGVGGGSEACDPFCDPLPPPSGLNACQQDGCERLELHAEQLPLALYLLVDRSGSMWSESLWEPSKSALIDFVSDASSAGIGVGLKLFPHAGNSACSETWYKVDSNLEVPYGVLSAEAAPADTQEQAVIDALDAVECGAMNTPVEAALLGAYQWAEWRLGQQAEQKVAVVLLTDGRPELCAGGGDVDVAKLAALAALKRAEHGIATYTIGLPGAAQDALEQLAAAGSEDGQAIMVDSGPALSAELGEALSRIRTASLPCEIQVPPKAPTEQIDICYAPGGDESQTALINDDAWSLEGDSISISDAMCKTLLADKQGQLEVVFNCLLK